MLCELILIRFKTIIRLILQFQSDKFQILKQLRITAILQINTVKNRQNGGGELILGGICGTIQLNSGSMAMSKAEMEQKK